MVRSMGNGESKRIAAIDALRGLSIVLMVAYHLGFDLVYYAGLPRGLLYNPLLNVLQPFFASVFILLSGLSCKLSHSNLRRGVLLFLLGAGVTVVSMFTGLPIYMGILSFLGAAIILYDLLTPVLRKIPGPLLAAVNAAAFTVTYCFFPREADVSIGSHLWMLGLYPHGFKPADYFPLLPWFFLLLLGTTLAEPVMERRLPAWFYRVNPPVLPFLGRHTLLIYLLHQPLLVGIFWIWQRLTV